MAQADKRCSAAFVEEVPMSKSQQDVHLNMESPLGMGMAAGNGDGRSQKVTALMMILTASSAICRRVLTGHMPLLYEVRAPPKAYIPTLVVRSSFGNRDSSGAKQNLPQKCSAMPTERPAESPGGRVQTRGLKKQPRRRLAAEQPPFLGKDA